jgi:aryl-alcohol dehydrogenase-like predicted oxidoreductase
MAHPSSSIPIRRQPELILGTMNFGRRTPEAEALRIVDVAWDLGIRHFDTANAYVDGEGERILGRALRGRRDRATLTTKVGLGRIGGSVDGLIRSGGRSEGLSRGRILEACDESLLRLGTDYIDIYYLHVPDASTPIEESLSAIAMLLEQGKVRAFGVSNYASWQILEMIHWCDAAPCARPAMAQQLYNLLVRQLDIEYFAFARRYGVHTAAYNPLAGGLLTEGSLAEAPRAGSRFHENAMYQRRYFSERFRANAEAYRALAAELGLSLTTLAHAFLASHPSIDSIVLGPAVAAHVEEAVTAASLHLEGDVVSRLAEMYREHEGTDATYARI